MNSCRRNVCTWPAYDPRHGQPLHRTDGDKEKDKFPTKKDHQQNDKDRERQRINDIDDSHHECIDLAANKSGNGAVKDADG